MSCEDKKAKVDAAVAEKIQAQSHDAMMRVVSLPQAERRDEVTARTIGAVCRACDTRRRVLGVDICGEPDADGNATVIWEMLRIKGQSCRFGKHAETLRRLGVE